jgi:MscS family membrane protein
MDNMPSRKSICIILGACLWVGLLAAGCSTPESPGVTPRPPAGTPTLQAEVTATPAAPAEKSSAQKIHSTPTPAPTATPDPLTLAIDRLASSTGADRFFFGGAALKDWLNALVSILIYIVIVLLLLRLLHALLRRLTARTSDETDNQLLERLWPQVSWVVNMLALALATSRLAFLSPQLKQGLGQLYQALIIMTLAVAALRLLNFVVARYKERVEPQHEGHQIDQVLVLVQRLTRLVIVMVTILMVLSIYNVNVNALLAGMGIGGLAISLAAKDTLANMISGLTLMLDKPFRVGDRIEVAGAGTWGDVIDIGLRSTRVRTGDNRMIFIPNSILGNDRVINYSFQDPSLRSEVDFAVGYDPDIETVRRIVVDAVRQVDGVLEDRPVEVLYVRMGDTGRILRVRWWDRSYTEKWQVIDRVNSAVQNSLNAAGIKIPSNVSFRTTN